MPENDMSLEDFLEKIAPIIAGKKRPSREEILAESQRQFLLKAQSCFNDSIEPTIEKMLELLNSRNIKATNQQDCQKVTYAETNHISSLSIHIENLAVQIDITENIRLERIQFNRRFSDDQNNTLTYFDIDAGESIDTYIAVYITDCIKRLLNKR